MKRVNNCLVLLSAVKKRRIKFICTDVHKNCSFYQEGGKMDMEDERGIIDCCNHTGEPDKDGNWTCKYRLARKQVFHSVRQDLYRRC